MRQNYLKSHFRDQSFFPVATFLFKVKFKKKKKKKKKKKEKKSGLWACICCWQDALASATALFAKLHARTDIFKWEITTLIKNCN